MLFGINRPLSNYASVPVVEASCEKIQQMCENFVLASTSGNCSRELKRNSKEVYWPLTDPEGAPVCTSKLC